MTHDSLLRDGFVFLASDAGRYGGSDYRIYSRSSHQGHPIVGVVVEVRRTEFVRARRFDNWHKAIACFERRELTDDDKLGAP